MTKPQKDAPMLPTPEDSAGPYYPLPFMTNDRSDLTLYAEGLVVRPEGQPITLSGRFLDLHGNGVPLMLLEFWHADAKGVEPSPGAAKADLDLWFSGYGRQYCKGGVYEIRTIKPGAVRSEGGTRAPHISFNMFCDGINRLATQIFFEGEALNDSDPLLQSIPAPLRQRLIARRESGPDEELRYHLDIILRGEKETPFFDDVES